MKKLLTLIVSGFAVSACTVDVSEDLTGWFELHNMPESYCG